VAGALRHLGSRGEAPRAPSASGTRSPARSPSSAPPPLPSVSSSSSRAAASPREGDAPPDGVGIHPETPSRCDAGMVYVTGIHCPYVAHRCDEELGPPRAESRVRRCARFRDVSICGGGPVRLSFCIDRFEYPNLPGVRPAVMASYRDAKRVCRAEGKRLCEAEEWRFACEGPLRWPYPTGRIRDAEACHLDRVPRAPDRAALRSSFETAGEVARLDQRRPSGADPRCVSPFGVVDASGNVAEWVHDREGDPHDVPRVTALAGGDWERSPGTCRTLDGRHGAGHRSHTSGFRCCSDARGVSPRQRMPPGFRLPVRRPLQAPPVAPAAAPAVQNGNAERP
ncbi:MAG: SUMF1/EgtB/PvdO family nonheme iron enzyme, partial [Myxococcota bacterium]